MAHASKKLHTAKIELYRDKGKIHARTTSGRFNSWRWGMVWLTQIIFYGACWLPWTVGDTTRQAVLFDIAERKFYFFGLVLWPQDALLLALVLIISAAGLFFVTTLAGRLFCGFACPQTVYTAIFAWVEAKVEGNHLARARLDAEPMNARKARLRITKHTLWGLIALWTGITFVGYFTPIRELLAALPTGDIGPWAGFWLLFYSVFTYVQAGLVREAMCQHMCPYSRFQGVMVDERTRNVAYDAQRGEPRQSGRRDGACIDCGICVQVCPVGIDIRAGQQYPCINCGLCIDGCDTVMRKLGAPTGLIRFASELELAGKPALSPLREPRVWAYVGLIAVSTLGCLVWLLERPALRADVFRDRTILMRETEDGRIENGYTLNLSNLSEQPVSLQIAAEGPEGLQVVSDAQFTAAPGSVQPVQVTLSVPVAAKLSGIQPVRIKVTPADLAQLDSKHIAQVETTFLLP